MANVSYTFEGKKVTAYKDNTKNGYWWAKDTTGHADVAFKVFKRQGNKLIWVSDADKYGNFITGKHKSNVGKTINLK